MEQKSGGTAAAVTVFGSSQAGHGAAHYRQALELGRGLARRGVTIRCGGYGGVMEAVASGAREEGGRVVGCTLRWFAEARVPNVHLDEVHEARSLTERIECLLRGSRAAIVLPGGVGTLNELFWVWTLLLFDREDGPNSLVLLGEPWEDLLAFLARRFEFGPPVRSLVRVALSPEEAVRIACGEATEGPAP